MSTIIKSPIFISFAVSFLTACFVNLIMFIILKKKYIFEKKGTRHDKGSICKNNFHTIVEEQKEHNVGVTPKKKNNSTSNNHVTNPRVKQGISVINKKEETQTSNVNIHDKFEEREPDTSRFHKITNKIINPKVTKPENAIYTELAIYDGKLIPCTIGKIPYYRTWSYEGNMYYEFFCENSRLGKAVNNHSTIIDPFCQKDSKSVPTDSVTSFTIVEFGEIDKDYNIINKAIIRYK